MTDPANDNKYDPFPKHGWWLLLAFAVVCGAAFGLGYEYMAEAVARALR